MDKKYYTPTIEEFHVGFEYEFKQVFVHDSPTIELKQNNFIDKELTKEDGSKYFHLAWWEKMLFSITGTYNFHGTLIENHRVKYLDKEDIESLGWTNSSKMLSPMFFEIKDYRMVFYISNDYKIRIFENNNIVNDDIKTFDESQLFYGTIKNKSELKILMKQLNII